MTLRVISYGGGVQSTSMLVLAGLRNEEFEDAMGGPVDAALFANVGDDSEHPATLRYVREVAVPWARRQGVEVELLQHVTRDGDPETLWQQLARDTRNASIPVRLSPSGMPTNRSCTVDFKVKVLARWLKKQGATLEDPAVIAIGISTDEIDRVNGKKTTIAYERNVYPLIDMGMDRSACAELIRRAGLPVPPKSACFFCPFHTNQGWAEMRRDEPELFASAAELESRILEAGERHGNLPRYLSRLGAMRGRRLTDVIVEAQPTLPFAEGIGESGCDEGYCWT